jgi:hypothetical protein
MLTDLVDVGGERVYEATPEGDGIFTDYERDKYLTEAIQAIERERSLTTGST